MPVQTFDGVKEKVEALLNETDLEFDWNDDPNHPENNMFRISYNKKVIQILITNDCSLWIRTNYIYPGIDMNRLGPQSNEFSFAKFKEGKVDKFLLETCKYGVLTPNDGDTEKHQIVVMSIVPENRIMRLAKDKLMARIEFVDAMITDVMQREW